MRLSIIAVLAFTAASASAASGQGTPPSVDTSVDKAASAAKPAGTAKHDPSLITSDEIAAAKLPTAYDLVERLRRPWLRPDALTGGSVVVYIDEQNVGDASALRDLPSVEVSKLQYLSNADAVKHWGAVVKGSVIVVTRSR